MQPKLQPEKALKLLWQQLLQWSWQRRENHLYNQKLTQE
jgi:hypothetical protein